MMELIKADTGHIPVIQSISSRVWPRTFSPILSPGQIRYMMEWMYSTESLRQQLREQGHRYYLARKQNEFVGYLSVEHRYGNTDRTKVHKIYVLPEVQGTGCGRFLLESAEELAQKEGDSFLSLNVNRNNPAVRFYEKLGFTVEKEENIDIGSGFVMEDYVMVKRL